MMSNRVSKINGDADKFNVSPYLTSTRERIRTSDLRFRKTGRWRHNHLETNGLCHAISGFTISLAVWFWDGLWAVFRVGSVQIVSKTLIEFIGDTLVMAPTDRLVVSAPLFDDLLGVLHGEFADPAFAKGVEGFGIGAHPRPPQDAQGRPSKIVVGNPVTNERGAIRGGMERILEHSVQASWRPSRLEGHDPAPALRRIDFDGFVDREPVPFPVKIGPFELEGFRQTQARQAAKGKKTLPSLVRARVEDFLQVRRRHLPPLLMGHGTRSLEPVKRINEDAVLIDSGGEYQLGGTNVPGYRCLLGWAPGPPGGVFPGILNLGTGIQFGRQGAAGHGGHPFGRPCSIYFVDAGVGDEVDAEIYAALPVGRKRGRRHVPPALVVELEPHRERRRLAHNMGGLSQVRFYLPTENPRLSPGNPRLGAKGPGLATGAGGIVPDRFPIPAICNEPYHLFHHRDESVRASPTASSLLPHQLDRKPQRPSQLFRRANGEVAPSPHKPRQGDGVHLRRAGNFNLAAPVGANGFAEFRQDGHGRQYNKIAVGLTRGLQSISHVANMGKQNKIERNAP